MEIVIGLIGAKEAGKTTAFEAIKDILDVQEITLASKLKDVCASTFDIPRNAFDSHKLKEKDLEDPVFLTMAKVSEIFSKYDLFPNFDKFVRPHVGKVLLTPRQVAQYVGTEVLRSYKQDIHCDEACKAITKNIGVVTDLRFPNELEYFSKHYPRFYPLYIKNLGAEVKASRDSHASEAHLEWLASRALAVLPNNGAIRDFQNMVQWYVKTFT